MSDEQWPEWVVSYQFEGSKWGLSIFAPTADDARRRLRAIGMTASVDGMLCERIPAILGAGLYIRAKTFLLNLFRVK